MSVGRLKLSPCVPWPGAPPRPRPPPPRPSAPAGLGLMDSGLRLNTWRNRPAGSNLITPVCMVRPARRPPTQTRTSAARARLRCLPFHTCQHAGHRHHEQRRCAPCDVLVPEPTKPRCSRIGTRSMVAPTPRCGPTRLTSAPGPTRARRTSATPPAGLLPQARPTTLPSVPPTRGHAVGDQRAEFHDAHAAGAGGGQRGGATNLAVGRGATAGHAGQRAGGRAPLLGHDGWRHESGELGEHEPVDGSGQRRPSPAT